MAATEGMIGRVSPYEVTADGPFTPQIFSTLAAVALAKLDQDDPGLSAALYDYAHALLIIHLFEVKKGSGGGIISEKLGDYQYTRVANGKTTYLAEYDNLIASATAKVARTAATAGEDRSDKAMADFELDGAGVPSFEEE